MGMIKQCIVYASVVKLRLYGCIIESSWRHECEMSASLLGDLTEQKEHLHCQLICFQLQGKEARITFSSSNKQKEKKEIKEKSIKK